MKRLRKEIAPRQVKYLMSGEYGTLGRPHYHFLLFGLMPTSEQCERWWQHQGFVSIGQLTMESAQYVCGYVLKKIDRTRRRRFWSADGGFELTPEFATMSRGGRTGRGLAHGWYEKYGEEVERLDSVVSKGKEFMPPRYYDKLLKEKDELVAESVKLRRLRKSKGVTSEELMAREIILKSQLIELKRKLQ